MTGMGNTTASKSAAGITLAGTALVIIGGLAAFVGIAGFNSSPGRYGHAGGTGFQVTAYAGIALAVVGAVFLCIALFRAADRP
jgi:hypothetical protein